MSLLMDIIDIVSPAVKCVSEINRELLGIIDFLSYNLMQYRCKIYIFVDLDI